MPKSDMTVLVTGADGFIGSHLCYSLARSGFRCHAVTGWAERPWLPFWVWARNNNRLASISNIDIADRRQVEKVIATARPDVIFHMAAMSQVKDAEVSPLEAVHVNTVGTANVIEAALNSKWEVKPLIIIASSDKAYGGHDYSDGTRLTEQSLLKPKHPYDGTKAAADLIAQSYQSFYKLPIVITRFANVYGPSDVNWQRLIPGVLRDIIVGREPYLRSDGSDVREYLYITDAMAAYKAIIKTVSENRENSVLWDQPVVNVAANQGHSVREIMSYLGVLIPSFNPKSVAYTGDSKTETPKIALHDGYLRALTGWQPKVKLAEGLTVTINWLSYYLGADQWREEWFASMSPAISDAVHRFLKKAGEPL